jgi:hypothetical protein
VPEELPVFEEPLREPLAFEFVEFELVVPLRTLSSLTFESEGVVVVLLLSPGEADVLSPRLVAPAIATGTPRQNTIAIAGTALSVLKGCRFKLFNVFMS